MNRSSLLQRNAMRLFFALLLGMSNLANGQYLIEGPEVPKEKKGYTLHETLIGSGANKFYLWKLHCTDGIASTVYKRILSCYGMSMELQYSVSANPEENKPLLPEEMDMVVIGNQPMVTHVNRIEKENSNFALDLRTLDAQGNFSNAKPIFRIPNIKEHVKILWKVFYNSDSSAMGLIVIDWVDKLSSPIAYGKIFKKDGSEFLSKTWTLPYGEDFIIHRIALDQQNTFHFISEKFHSKSTRASNSTESQFTLTSFTSTDIVEQDLTIDASEIKEIALKIDSKNLVSVLGYYGPEKNDDMNGLFHFRFDEQGKLAGTRKIPFTQRVISDIGGAKQTISNIAIKDMIELPDGEMYVVGEQFSTNDASRNYIINSFVTNNSYLKRLVDNRYTNSGAVGIAVKSEPYMTGTINLNYNHGSIFIHRISKQGEEKWSRAIYKAQTMIVYMSSSIQGRDVANRMFLSGKEHSPYSSYAAILLKNNLHILFVDLAKNEGKTEYSEIKESLNVKSRDVKMYSIKFTDTGDWSKKSVEENPEGVVYYPKYAGKAGSDLIFHNQEKLTKYKNE